MLTLSESPPLGLDHPIRQQLKSRTQAIHANTEKASFMRLFLAPSLQPADYTRLLETLYQRLAPIEATLARSVHLLAFPAVKERVYFHALTRELAKHDTGACRPPAGAPTSAPASAPSRARVAGMLYALEGSALGGRVLASRIAHASPTGYFATQAQLAASRWPAFVMNLETTLTSDHIDEAVKGAAQVFRAFLAED